MQFGQIIREVGRKVIEKREPYDGVFLIGAILLSVLICEIFITYPPWALFLFWSLFRLGFVDDY